MRGALVTGASARTTGLLSRGSQVYRLGGSDDFIAGLGGRAAVAIGVLITLLMVLPVHGAGARLPIGVIGAGAFTFGIFLIRFPLRLPLPVLDVMMVGADGLLVYIGQYSGPLTPALPGIYLVMGTIIFAARHWIVVTGHAVVLGASYAGVLAVGPPTFAPVSRWLGVMTVLVSTGLFVRWLVGTVAGLATAEHEARDITEHAAVELERVSRAKSVFLSRMSHELRTPLNVVMGFADLLGQQRVGPLSERQAEYVTDISESARHLVALVDDVLDLATVESGGIRLNATLFDIRQVVDDSVTLVRDQATRKQLTVVVDVDPQIGAIEADRTKVRQTVVNLLANAVKFTPVGGVVTVRAQTVGDRVAISVADTGIGIAPEDLDRIFERFAQSVRGHEGTGLGLPLARRFVELHGGRMRVESTPGEGSVFRFELPRRPTLFDPADSGAEDESGVREHSAFTRPGSRANRRLITRITMRLLMTFGVLIAVMALLTPTDTEDRWLAVALGLAGAAVVAVGGRRIPVPSFAQVEWAGWVFVVGLSVLTFYAESFASLAPLTYGWVTIVAIALWPRSRALIILAGVVIGYTTVLFLHPGPNPLTHWLAIVTLLMFNAEVVSWIIGRYRQLVVAEQEAHRNANRVREQLAATSRHKSAFVANMSHELRTPLNAVIGFADLLAGEKVGSLNERQREFVSDIQEAARSLLAIINEVLDSARLEAGQMRLQLDVIPVRALLEGVIARIEPRAVERIGALNVHVGDHIDFVVADRERLQQVLVELVFNAVKFTPDSGRVEVTADAMSSGELHISVKDSGIGILPDQIDRIFEPFHQGTRMPSHYVPSGTGLGLSLAKGLIELHGGRIWVESVPDHGSTFTVALPIVMTGMRSFASAGRPHR